MEQSQLNWIANFIWGIADDVLRDLYVRGKYRDVILPMTVLRKLDAVLEPTKRAVLDMKVSLDTAGIIHQDQALRQAAGQAFYNTSKFTLRDLKNRASRQHLKTDFEAYLAAVERDANRHKVKLTAKRKKLLQTALAERDEGAREVIARIHNPGKTAPDPLRGLFPATIDGKPAVVEYEPDPELRDTEQVPLLEEGGIEAFLRREVLPHAPDAWYVPDSVKTGYEISFTRYFYKPQPLRTLEEIRADILALERETEGLLQQILLEEKP